MKANSILSIVCLCALVLGSCQSEEEKTPLPLEPQDRSQNFVIMMSMSEMKTRATSGEWNSWNYPRGAGANPDHFTNESGRRQMDLAFYPTIGLYDMADKDYQEYTCQLMKMCYIDAISHHLKGSGNDKHRRDGLRQFAQVCRKYGVYGMVRGGDRGSATSELWVKEMMEFIKDQEASVMSLGGKTVSSFFSINDENVNDLMALKEAYNKEVGKELYLIMRIKNLTEEQKKWKGAIDGGYDWVGFHAKSQSTKNYLGYDWYITDGQIRTNYNADIARGKACVRLKHTSIYIEGISPGFDDKVINGWGQGSHCVPRTDGKTYEWRWKQAVKNNFPGVVIPTWNDYPEGSIIQPSVEFGNNYMEMTRKYAAEYKGKIVNTGNLLLPEWIYKIRKLTKNKLILSDLEEASQKIITENYQAAEEIVLRHKSKFPVIDQKYFDPALGE